MSQKIKITCPYCHYETEPDLSIEVVFENIAFTFKCKKCKKHVRIYAPLKEYGEIVRDG
jgi:uncharacterized Zn-finger protein